MDLLKAQKQGRDENTQEDYLTLEQWQKKDNKTTLYLFTPFVSTIVQTRVVFLHVFISALFMHFLYVHPYLKLSSFQKPLLLVSLVYINKQCI